MVDSMLIFATFVYLCFLSKKLTEMDKKLDKFLEHFSFYQGDLKHDNE